MAVRLHFLVFLVGGSGHTTKVVVKEIEADIKVCRPGLQKPVVLTSLYEAPGVMGRHTERTWAAKCLYRSETPVLTTPPDCEVREK